MSELLRKANSLMGARRRINSGDSPSITSLYEHFDSACDVIENYQDLVRKMVKKMERCREMIECEWGEPGWLGIIDEAKACIPEE